MVTDVPGAWVRFVGGPLDGQRRWFELLVDPDGRPHERLARHNSREGCKEVYRLSAGPFEGNAWEFVYVGSEPMGTAPP